MTKEQLAFVILFTFLIGLALVLTANAGPTMTVTLECSEAVIPYSSSEMVIWFQPLTPVKGSLLPVRLTHIGLIPDATGLRVYPNGQGYYVYGYEMWDGPVPSEYLSCQSARFVAKKDCLTDLAGNTLAAQITTKAFIVDTTAPKVIEFILTRE